MRTITELHDAFDRKQVSVVEATQERLKLARANALNAYLEVSEKRALEQARAADAIIAREGRVPRATHPLLGVPMGIKDSLVIRGVRTAAGSKILENYIPPYTATSVERLEGAGAVTLGKLNQDEFAMGGSNENSAFGPVKHPTHPDRVPGGSSGGSAAAVREGSCIAALGSDTGGSVRQPAAFCGVVGLKPTYGRVSRSGLIAFASSLDQVGPVTSTVEDTAIVFEAMAGHDPLDSTSSPRATEAFTQAGRALRDLAGLRIGVPEEYFSEGLSPDVERAVRAAIAWYESKGARPVPIKLPNTPHAVPVYYLVAMSEASSNLSRFDGVRFGVRPPEALQAHELADFYAGVRKLFGAEVKRRILLGTFALSAGYAEAYYQRACQVRRLIQQDFIEAFKQVDIIAGPVAPTSAWKLGEKSKDPLAMYLADIFTVPASLAGLPAISVPCGEDSQGLPIGLQLIAPHFEEARLLSVAAAFEKGRAK